MTEIFEKPGQFPWAESSVPGHHYVAKKLDLEVLEWKVPEGEDWKMIEAYLGNNGIRFHDAGWGIGYVGEKTEAIVAFVTDRLITEEELKVLFNDLGYLVYDDSSHQTSFV